MRAVFALIQRYLYLYRRNPVRLFELVFWPVMHMITWGYLTVFLQQQTSGSFPVFISYLFGAIILWDIIFRAQQGVAISFLEDLWTRNLLNIYAAPINPLQYVGAFCGIGLLRALFTGCLLSLLALFLYHFDVLQIGPALVPLILNLLIFGWALGLISMAMVLRFGQGVESLAWAVPFIIQPFSAVFYPVDVLPHWMQFLSHAVPASHVFGGLRGLFSGGSFPSAELAWATGLNLIWLLICALIFARTLVVARRKGLLVKIATN